MVETGFSLNVSACNLLESLLLLVLGLKVSVGNWFPVGTWSCGSSATD